ncbi:hypothetical protein HKD37_16G046416 [Glycine soja]
MITKLIYKIEGTHVRLKRLFHNSIRDLCICSDAMNNMLIASFQKSMSMVDHKYNTLFYKNYEGYVSTQAQSLIFILLKRYATVGVGNSPCSCGSIFKTTHDLPCVCKLARYIHISSSIPLSSIHVIRR